MRPTLALADRVQRDQLGVEAGSLTYGAFLSLPPMLLLLISVAGVVFQQRADTAQQELIEAVGDIVPGFDQVVTTQLQLSRGIAGGHRRGRASSASSMPPPASSRGSVMRWE